LFELSFLEFLRRIDKNFDIYTMGIFNKYILKGRWGGKVVPLNKNIDADTKFLPTQEIIEIVKRSNTVGIGWCYCRAVQRKYNKPNCDNPMYTCIHLSFGTSLYEIPYKSYKLKEVSKKEIYQLLEESDNRGLIHQLIYFPNPQFYYIICNCCPCCCVVLNKFLEKGSPQMIKSEFIATTDYEKCINCGECEKWCYFGARKIKSDTLSFESIRCYGCGICVSKCPEKAIILTRK
jgi:Pyruvate/2-oxoacid:ferredoxin oxidoreductase delta subunit